MFHPLFYCQLTNREGRNIINRMVTTSHIKHVKMCPLCKTTLYILICPSRDLKNSGEETQRLTAIEIKRSYGVEARLGLQKTQHCEELQISQDLSKWWQQKTSLISHFRLRTTSVSGLTAYVLIDEVCRSKSGEYTRPQPFIATPPSRPAL